MRRLVRIQMDMVCQWRMDTTTRFRTSNSALLSYRIPSKKAEDYDEVTLIAWEICTSVLWLLSNLDFWGFLQRKNCSRGFTRCKLQPNCLTGKRSSVIWESTNVTTNNISKWNKRGEEQINKQSLISSYLGDIICRNQFM